MTEAITHKRQTDRPPLKDRISSVSSDTLNKDVKKKDVNETPEQHARSRRRALNSFYKVQEEQKQQQTSKQPPQPSESPIVLTPDTFDEYASRADFVQLLKDEDKILEELSNNQSEIKSIIYNNYYELIKINDMLLKLKKRNELNLRESSGKLSLEEGLSSVKESLSTLEDIDMDFTTERKVSTEDEQVCKGVSRLLLEKNGNQEQLDQLEEALPNVKRENLILELNEVREKISKSMR